MVSECNGVLIKGKFLNADENGTNVYFSTNVEDVLSLIALWKK